MWDNLNKREQRFVELYPALKFNGTEAAKQAGYSEKRASQTAAELLKRPAIAAALAEKYDELTKKADSDAMEIIKELHRVGMSDIRDLIEYDNEGVRVRPSSSLSDDVARTVQEVSITHNQFGPNIKIKTHDKLAALEKLGKYHKLFVDVHEHKSAVPVRDYSKMSDEEIEKELKELEKKEKEMRGK